MPTSRQANRWWWAQDALDQINDKGYAARYATDGRRIVKVGMGFSIEKRSLTDYLIVDDKLKTI